MEWKTVKTQTKITYNKETKQQQKKSVFHIYKKMSLSHDALMKNIMSPTHVIVDIMTTCTYQMGIWSSDMILGMPLYKIIIVNIFYFPLKPFTKSWK